MATDDVSHVNPDFKIVIAWKITLIVLGTIGLLTCVVRIPGFWSSYVLDIVGPAWNYILLRGLYSSNASTCRSSRLGPETTALAIFVICCAIETGQYFRLYDAYYDPYDYIAYFSLLLPVYLTDKCLAKSSNVMKKGSRV